MDPDSRDAVWDTALEWVMREHECGLTPSDAAQLAWWSDASPKHLVAYKDAASVWAMLPVVIESGCKTG